MQGSNVYGGIILLILFSVCFVSADSQVIPPSPSQSTSIQKLVDSIAALKSEIAGLKKDSKELKIQLGNKLDAQYNGLMVFFVLFIIGFTSMSRLLGRFYGWFVFRRVERKSVGLMSRLLDNLEACNLDVALIHRNLITIRDKIEPGGTVIKAPLTAKTRIISLLLKLSLLGACLWVLYLLLSYGGVFS